MKDILRIPLAASTVEDTRIWNQHKRGYYTVRTTYYLCRDLKKLRNTARMAGSGTSTVVPLSNWSFVWKLNLPNKLKVLVWRLLKCALPISTNLIR